MLRRVLLAVFLLLTAVLVYSATQLRVDAGFSKMVPLEHEYMRTFTEYQKTFGGANRVLVALRVKGAGGDIYTPEFMRALKGATDDVFFIPGVDRATVTSLFTPNVRFIEVVEEGFAGGNVVPATFRGTPTDLEIVRQNVLKSGNVGRLVANDFRGALIRAELLEADPVSGQRLNYSAVAKQLEAVRAKYQSDGIDVHIIGFAKAVGDITEGAIGVLAFFAVAFVITAILLYVYKRSLSLTILTLVCALMPVIWLLGLLPLLGYGIDPMSILVPVPDLLDRRQPRRADDQRLETGDAAGSRRPDGRPQRLPEAVHPGFGGADHQRARLPGDHAHQDRRRPGARHHREPRRRADDPDQQDPAADPALVPAGAAGDRRSRRSAASIARGARFQRLPSLASRW